MKQFRKIFFRLLKIIPITALAVIIIGCLCYVIFKNITAPTEISEEAFINKAFENNINFFKRTDKLIYTLEDSSGKIFSHSFDNETDALLFEKLIQEKFGSFGSGGYYANKGDFNDFYLPLVAITLYIAFLVLIFYCTVILWLVCLFDLLKSEFTQLHNKWIWLVVMIVLPFIAPLFYLFIAEKQKRVILINNEAVS